MFSKPTPCLEMTFSVGQDVSTFSVTSSELEYTKQPLGLVFIDGRNELLLLHGPGIGVIDNFRLVFSAMASTYFRLSFAYVWPLTSTLFFSISTPPCP